MELKFILEAILFGAPKPMTIAELKDVLLVTAERSEDPAVRAFKKTKADELAGALETLVQDYETAARSFRLICVAGAWQWVSQSEYAPWLRVVAGEKARPPRLSQPALETLAIIAYRQPLTRAEIEQIRGVSVDGVMQTLLERGLIEQVGRAEVVGRPITYGTATAFLEYFGLRDLDGLPDAPELRRIEVQKPESLLTVEPGLATVPPEQLALAEPAESQWIPSSPSVAPEIEPAVTENQGAAPTPDLPPGSTAEPP
jgi:segregation and condensation protein B